jgi:hypothetical protein
MREDEDRDDRWIERFERCLRVREGREDQEHRDGRVIEESRRLREGEATSDDKTIE